MKPFPRVGWETTGQTVQHLAFTLRRREKSFPDTCLGNPPHQDLWESVASEVLGSRTFWIGAAAGAFYKVMGENLLGGDGAEAGQEESGWDGMGWR